MEDRRNGAVSERVARLRIELQELEPKIWRRIDMPVDRRAGSAPIGAVIH